MPIQYSIASQQNALFLKAWGDVPTEEVREHVLQLRQDPEFQPDCRALFDLRDVTSTNHYYRQMKKLMPYEAWGEESKRAVVVKSALIFGLTRTFVLLAKNTQGEISIFRNIEKAADSLELKLEGFPTRGAEREQLFFKRFLNSTTCPEL